MSSCQVISDFSQKTEAAAQSASVLHFPVLPMLMKVFLPGSQSAPNMPFRFINVQYYTGTGSQGGIDLEETFRNILMYRRFRHPKFLRRLPYRGFLFNNIICNFNSTLFNIIFQGKSPEICAFYNLCREIRGHSLYPRTLNWKI